jgi:predicted nucleic acid-binding protein
MLGHTKLESNMRVSKFVLDNNIRVSYFITKKENTLLEIIEKYGLAIYSCDELLRECAMS